MHGHLKPILPIAILGLTFLIPPDARPQSNFAGNAQHTAIYSTAAQNLNSVHWTTSIDLNNSGAFAHYGAPVLTPANTIFVPVKTGPSGGFQINAFNGGAGSALYSLTTDYIAASSQWIIPYQPVLATSSQETRLYYPGAGGTVYYIDNVDSTSHGTPVRQVFYTSLSAYQSNAGTFNSTIFIDTPITADNSGNIFFGFRVQGTAPAPLSTQQSGYARIDLNGNGTYVLAGTAAGDSNIVLDSHSAGPAVSNDQSTVYVVVKSNNADSSYGYLLGLDATSLATKYKVFLRDPRGNNANPATLLDISTASPMVGPDNDVYFGIYGYPANGSRGFLLHFSADLTVEKAPGGFGWDYTPGVVPASMVPSYTGPSSYLLLTKYNNYANAGNDSADGVNRVAVLDPGSTEVDAHASSNGMAIMREVLTVIGPTADYENRSASYPYAVREWCINSPGVDPATNSVFFPSEDGRIYRWNLATNSLDQWVQLNKGLGEPYVPTIIGPDGTVFTLNGGTFAAAGSLAGVGIALTSSMPDVRSTVTGQSLTFSVAVTNTGTSGFTPTGTITLKDTVYYLSSPGVVSSTTTTLASNFPLNGTAHAAFTTSALTADRHFITASYSGDSHFSAGTSSLIQFIHASATTTALASSTNPSAPGQPITLTAAVASVPPGTGTPTGQVTFQNGSVVIGQVPLNASGIATLTTSNLSAGINALTAVYASDTNFAASTGSLAQSVQTATSTTVTSSLNPSNFGQAVTFTSTTTSTTGTPTGTVTFTEGSTVLASGVSVDSSGQASFSTAALAVGSNVVMAAFTGVGGWANSAGNAAQLVNAASTSTSVGSSPNPSTFGQPVTFTSSTTSTAGTPAGTVTFTDGATVLASNVAVNGSGQASFSTAALAAGSHTITAAFTGAAGWPNSSGTASAQVVNPATTTTTATSSPNPSNFGQWVTFTSTASSTGGTPAGTVTFTEGATVLASNIAVNGSGQASFSTTSLAVGSHTITATFTGTANWASSSGNAAPQVVNAFTTATTAASSPNPSVFGQSVTFTSTTTSSGGSPAGTVTFTEGATVWAANVLVSSGKASFSTTALSIASHTITASFTGNPGWANSSGNAPAQIVNNAATTTALVSSAGTSVYSQPVTFTATVTATAPGGGVPTGTVTFKNGAATLGTGTLNASGIAALTTSALTVGSATISAAYGGGNGFNASTSSGLRQTVNQDGSVTMVTASINPSVYSQPVTLMATVTAGSPGAGVPTGSVTFKSGGSTLGTGALNASGQATLTTSALAVGSDSITADYGGSTGFKSSNSAVLTQTVHQDATTTTLASSANPSVFSQAVTLTAAVTTNAPGSGVPTGTVTFKNGAATLGTATLNGSGIATLIGATLPVGSSSITAVYGGSTDFSTSTSSALTQTVNPASTKSTVTSSQNPSKQGHSVTFTATVAAIAPGTAAPTGTVSFKDGAATLGTAALNSGKATLNTSALSSGTHQITVVYEGSSNFLTSTSAVLVQTVN